MKNLTSLSFYIILGFLASCSNRTSENRAEYGPATKQLIELVDTNPDLKSMLIASIEKARQLNPDKTTNPAQNLEEYFAFVSHCETAMPWALLHGQEQAGILDQIFQGFDSFYFLIDQPLPELEGKGYFHNSLQYAEPFASWLSSFNKSWGKHLDAEVSWNDDYYQMALSDPAFGLQHGWYEDPSNWKTFNQFFARYLRSPEMRPIASPNDNSVVISCADSQPQGVWTIDSNSNIVVAEGVAVKSATIHSIVKLLGEDSQYKDAFASGTFTHSFLDVNDYHRYHFPLGGIIKEVRIIPGINPLGGVMSWDAENLRVAFDPSDIGWQMIEARGCVIMETDSFGLVALLPIGMAAIGSVNFEQNIKPGLVIKKGDMLGHFAFGGSDFIMLFQSKVKFVLDAPKQDGGEGYKHLLMGELLGSLTNTKTSDINQ
jgi:phosphatidylserine decarboxylase precursor